MPTASDAPAPRVLVAFSGRHGSTREVAAAISRGLRGGPAGPSGAVVRLAPVEQDPDPSGFDAVVLGSAVYGDRWLAPALRYAADIAGTVQGRPVWLFSCGLAAGPGMVGHGVADADRVASALGVRGHRQFAGRVERRLLSAAERAAWDPALAGDFRDWAAISAWSAQVAAEGALGPALPVAG